MIDGIKVNVLAKVGLDASNSHVKQWLQEVVLVPFHGFIIGEINGSRIVEGREIRTLRCLFLQQRSDILIGFSLFKLFCSLCHVWQLPQRHTKSFLLQILDKAFRVGKSFGIEFPFAQPIGTKPSCIEMNNVARIMLFP